jgi:hypothetical protein
MSPEGETISYLVRITHRRTGPLASELNVVQRHPDTCMAALSATGEQVYQPGVLIEDDEARTLAKLAVLFLYDLVFSLNRAATAPHPFLEQVRNARAEPSFAWDLAAPRTTAGYPLFLRAMGPITAAAPLLIASCTMSETEEGEHKWGQVLHLAWTSQEPLDALPGVVEGDSTADFAVLQWAS